MWKARRWLKGLFGRKTVDKNRRNSAPANPPLPLADVAGDNAPREWAAVVIQCHFRAYLSRKALRALKGLVKLQALIRGYIVRKQTAYVLQRLEALIRAQARTRVRTHSTITSTTYQKTWIHHKEPEEWEKKSPIRSHSTKLYDKSPQHKGHFYSSYHNKSRPRTPSYGELETLSRFEFPLYPDCDDNDSFSSVLYSTPSSRKEGFTSTPTKRVGTRSCYYGDYPSYMAYTESSRAKMRAFSVPRNRPLALFERSFSSRGCSDSPARSSPSIANRAYSISGY